MSCFVSGGSLIYGNVAVLIDAGMGESRGFSQEEEKAFTDWLKDIIQKEEKTISQIHEKYDGNKPELEIYLIPLD